MADRPLEIKFRSRTFRRGELADLVKELPRRLRGGAIQLVAKYYLKKFRLYPRYKYVSRARAYGRQAGGPGFFSDKQRRFVMAGLRSGRIPQPGSPHRSGELKRGWMIEGTGVNVRIVNRVPHAIWAHDDHWQARQLDLVGWKEVGEMHTQHEPGALAALWKDVVRLADEEMVKIMSGK